MLTLKRALVLAIVLCSGSVYASSSPDSMRAATAVEKNTKYATCLTLTKDLNGNIISFHVNGVAPDDARILINKDAAPLTTEYTIIEGQTKEGGISTYMLPSNIATARVIESISQDLVNAGAVSIQITKQINGTQTTNGRF